MSAWWLIAPGALGCLAVLVTAAKLAAGKHPPGRHVLESARAEELCAHCGNPPLGYARGYNDERLCHHEDRDCYHQVTVYGSMIWDEERALNPSGWLRGLDDVLASTTTTSLPRDPDDPYDPADDESWSWREQTAADLAPEALAIDDGPDPYLGALIAEFGSEFGAEVMPDASAVAMQVPGVQGSTSPVSPGPGDSSSAAPGPDSGTAMVAGEIPARLFLGHETAVPPTRLADTGDIASAHLLADVQAFMRAQDDDARAYGSAGELGWHDFMQQYWAGFTEALA